MVISRFLDLKKPTYYVCLMIKKINRNVRHFIFLYGKYVLLNKPNKIFSNCFVLYFRQQQQTFFCKKQLYVYLFNI